MKRKYPKCKICNGSGVINHYPGNKNKEYFLVCSVCNPGEKRFKDIQEAEDYYMENLAKNNEDEAGRDRWVEEHADEIQN